MGWFKYTISFFILAICYRQWYTYKAGCLFKPPNDLNVEGKTVLITGANSGIGLETAKELAKLGMRVILVCRDAERCDTAKKQVESVLPKNLKNQKMIFTELMDLTSLASVRDAARRIVSNHPKLHVLVNNAGLMAVPLSYTAEGHETHFGVNHLGHFLLTELLLPHMKKSGKEVRVINVSSEAHRLVVSHINLIDPGLTKNYNGFLAYGESKLANILHARELARRESQKKQKVKVVAVSLHPGGVATESVRTFPDFVAYLTKKLGPYLMLKTPLEGAQTSLFCVLDPSVVNHNGEYFKDCQPTSTSAAGKDENDAKKLWEISERLVAPFMAKFS